jgi:Phosphate-induced protein 1 conserved region
MKRLILIFTGVGVLLAACDPEPRVPTQPGVAASRSPDFESQHPHTHIMLPRGAPRRGNGAITTNGVQAGIFYHGGPIIYGQKVAVIYWSSSTIYNGGPTPGTTGAGTADGSLVGFFLNHLGGSAYYDINTTYYDGTGTYVQNSVTYTGYWAPNTDPGSTVSDAAIQAEVQAAFTSGALTFDPNTLYIVFSGPSVNLGGGFGNPPNYCGYHGHFAWNGNDVKYAAMPHDYDYPASCSGLQGSPNGDAAADAEVNVVTHEIEETNTDPDLSAWYDNSGNEVGDKCNFIFGTQYGTPNGAHANMRTGGKDFLIQQDWLNAGSGGCAISYGSDGLSAAIVGPYQVWEDYTCTWTAGVSGGTGPYAYSWDGSLFGSGSSFSYSSSTSGGFAIYLTVVDNHGYQASTSQFVTVVNPGSTGTPCE